MAFKRSTGWQHLLPCHRAWILGGQLKGDPSGVGSSPSNEMTRSFLPSRRLRAATLTSPHGGQQASLVQDWCVPSPTFKIMKCKLPGSGRSSLVLPASSFSVGLFLFKQILCRVGAASRNSSFLDFSSTSVSDFKRILVWLSRGGS